MYEAMIVRQESRSKHSLRLDCTSKLLFLSRRVSSQNKPGCSPSDRLIPWFLRANSKYLFNAAMDDHKPD